MRYVLLFIVAFQTHAQRSDFNHVVFNKADSIAWSCKDESLDNLPVLVHKLTSNLDTDVERFRAIFKWVCTNIANDYDLYSRHKRKRIKYRDNQLKLKQWNDRFKTVIFNKLLKKRRTICTGYAYLVKELAKLANLECEIIHGFGRTSMTAISAIDPPNHSWNAIKLNEKWYLCDPTWASGIPDPKTNIFKFYYNDGYFLASPELFAINHFPLDSEWSLIDENKTFAEFLDAPILYGNTYTYLQNLKAPLQFDNAISTTDIVNFKYKLLKNINPKQIELRIDDGTHLRHIKPNSIVLDQQSLTFTHQFKQSGFYDVHFYIDNALISTYTFDVSRN